MKSKYLFLAAMLSLSLAGCYNKQLNTQRVPAQPPVTTPANPPLNQNINTPPAGELKDSTTTYACVSDSDCTIVQRGCCNNGGASQVAINRSYENSWKQLYNTSCQNTMCPQFMTRSYTGTSCTNSKCELK